jgi:predicted transcriptional regulator
MTEYICGLCPTHDAYRSDTESNVRIHISQSKDARHRDIHGSDPQATILRTTEDDGSLTFSLAEEEADTDTQRDIYEAALKYPYLTAHKLSEVVDHSRSTIARALNDSERIRAERERHCLDFLRADSKYRVRDGEELKLAVDEPERSIIERMREHPSETAEEIIEALGLDHSPDAVRRIAERYTLPVDLPSTAKQRDIVLEAWKQCLLKNIDPREVELSTLNLTEIADAADATWSTAQRNLQKLKWAEFDRHEIATMRFDDEILQFESENLVETESTDEDSEEADTEPESDTEPDASPDLDEGPATDAGHAVGSEPERHRVERGNVTYEGPSLNAMMQHLGERPNQSPTSTTRESDGPVAAESASEAEPSTRQPRSDERLQEAAQALSEERARNANRARRIVGRVSASGPREPRIVLDEAEILYLIRLISRSNDHFEHEGLLKRLCRAMPPESGQS